MQIETLEALAAEHCFDAVAFAAFQDYENHDDINDAVEDFQDRFAGTADSLRAWAEEYIEETGMLAEIPEYLRMYFDYEAWSRDAECNGDIWTIDIPAGIAVFWR